MSNDLTWREIASKPLFEHRLLCLKESRQIGPEGMEGDYILLDAPDWVNVVAVLQEENCQAEFLLVRQYRFGAKRMSLEFPGGLVDSGETPLDAAKRELAEETGYTAREWIHLGSVNPNASFMTNTFHAYLAQGLQRSGEPDPDADEFIAVQKVPCTDILTGKIQEFAVNGIMQLPLCWYLQRFLESKNI